MPRNRADFDNEMDHNDDPTAAKLAARGIVKNTHGQEKPYDEYMQEPDSDRY